MTPTPTLTVLENGTPLTFRFTDMLAYHGPGFPGGVAHGFKVMERAFPLLAGGAAPERREIHIATAFPGPGGRDAFELVTRALTDGRYVVDASLAGPEVLESPKGRYYFRLGYRGTGVEVTIKPGHVRDEFITLARKDGRTPDEEGRLAELKQEMADRLMSLPATEIYDARVIKSSPVN